MRSRVRAFRAIVPVVAASSLLIAACGGDDDSSSSTGQAEQEDQLRPPVAVEAVGAGMGAGTEMSAEADATDSRNADPTDSYLPVFGGFDYALGEGMPPLPTNATGYEYPAGVDIDEATVTQLAAVFGVDGEPQRFEEGESIAWRVGPDDGSAPSLWVSADGQGNWSYSAAWSERPVGVACAEPGVTSIAPVSDVPVSDVAVSESPVEECVEPEPPAGVPTAAEAEQRVGDLLAAMGVDASTYEFETFADDWFASVNAMPVLDRVRSPIGTSFGFGADGVLEWASGSLATPIATGPYPLIDLDAAVARLREQGGLGYGVLTGGAVADSSVASEDAVVDDAAESSKPTETVVAPEGSAL
jgi:hypothetical protein